MSWYYLLIVVGLAVAWWALRMGRSRSTGTSRREERTSFETSDEISAPVREALDEGALKERDLRRDNLSKEVEMDWAASNVIEEQPGAYALERDFRKGPGDLPEEAGPDSTHEAPPEYRLPLRYGKDRLVLMARDPKWIYAYWEIAGEKSRELMEKRASEWQSSHPMLRLYDLSAPPPHRQVIDVELSNEADNWYVEVNRPSHRFVAEIGRSFRDGFVPLVRSNEVTLPPDLPAMELAEEWATWDMRYGSFLGNDASSSPGAWGKKIEG